MLYDLTCGAQNEVAYEYFGDNFSVTADCKYQKVLMSDVLCFAIPAMLCCAV